MQQPSRFFTTINRVCSALVPTIGSLFLIGSAQAIEGVDNYRHSYGVSYKGISVGNGVLSVSKRQLDGNQWQYSVSVKASSSGLAKLVGGEMTIDDSASGIWDSGTWFPGQFLHRQKDSDGLSVQEIYFNWPNNKLTNNDEGNVSTYTLKPNTIDYGTTFLVLQSMASRGCVSESYNQLVKGSIQSVTIQCAGTKKISGIPTYAFNASVGGQGFNAWMNQNPPHDLVKFTAINNGKTTISLSR